MDEIKIITADQLRIIVDQKGFPELLLAKDYYVTALLYLLKDVPGMYFKGGTALNKIFLNYARLSEDIDFTVTEEIEIVKEKIETIIEESVIFKNIAYDRRLEHFVRLIVHYIDPFSNEGTIFIDLNKKAKLLLVPEKHQVPHFYPGFIPPFLCTTLAQNEMVAEKMCAAIERNKPRDHFDLYQIISRGIPIDLNLVSKKVEKSGSEVDIIKVFNNAKKLKRKWDEDLAPLLARDITFQEVMITLAKHFHLKEEKEMRKKQTKP